MLYLDSKRGRNAPHEKTRVVLPVPQAAIEDAEIPAPVPQAAAAPVAPPVVLQEPQMDGFRGRILLAYTTALHAAGKNGIAPYDTLRDSLRSAVSVSPGASSLLTELTVLAETAFYAEPEPDESAATRAEELAARIKQG